MTNIDRDSDVATDPTAFEPSYEDSLRLRIDRPIRVSQVIKALRSLYDERGDVTVYADHAPGGPGDSYIIQPFAAIF
jgi:hypothetical protein